MHKPSKNETYNDLVSRLLFDKSDRNEKSYFFVIFRIMLGFLVKGKLIQLVLNPSCEAFVTKPTIMYLHRLDSHRQR